MQNILQKTDNRGPFQQSGNGQKKKLLRGRRITNRLTKVRRHCVQVFFTFTLDANLQSTLTDTQQRGLRRCEEMHKTDIALKLAGSAWCNFTSSSPN